MSSRYESDPGVPPARVERLGPRRTPPARGRDGLRVAAEPVVRRPTVRAQDPGPSYADFLESDDDESRSSDDRAV
ncbi:hypothetical protein [Frondihabitans australicus]|uniref:Uncharacterized protein n=1 Tax=Frondihabitans australicus TaxID=386892 RepID=A0A495IAD8_9MICO|nr:hypothetical protein [Frondihabitans australicus]RKR72983.1 hypothetical protein C8E83_0065 [Frondihabitans australicus]